MRRTLWALVALLTAALFASCDKDMVYSQYMHAAIGGWEKNEALTFEVDSIQQNGTYSVILGLRISDKYPFQNLHMVVEQTIYPSQKVVTDVVTCKVCDKRGTMLGRGVSFYQYDLPVRRLSYAQGDSVSIRVRHNMKREILPGITDVGITLKHNNEAR